VDFERLPQSGARITLRIDDAACGSIEVPQVMRMISSNGMNVGRDPSVSVSPDYTAPFEFQGRIVQLVFQLPEKSSRAERQAQRAEGSAFLARQ
jgi:arylsulfatase